MTIKRQIKTYISTIIAIPLVGIILLWGYYHMNRPERVLIEGSEALTGLKNSGLTDEDISNLKTELKRLPPEVQFVIIQNETKILGSNDARFQKNDTCDIHELYKGILNTSSKYIYQFISPDKTSSGNDILIALRFPKRYENPHMSKIIFILGFMIFLIFFEVFLIISSVKLGRTIYRSIGILQDNTQRIVEGDLEGITDTSSDRYSNNEITKLTDNLNIMRESLKENEQRKDRFIMGISHDLRSPVAVIKGYTEALKDGIFTDKTQRDEALDIIENKSEQLKSMIDTLINFVKLESVDLRNTLEVQPLKPYIETYVKNCRLTTELFKRKFSSKINLREDTKVAFNKQLIARAFENLMSNAVRYTKVGDKISLNADENDSEITITFSDAGPGISEESQKQIFDLFYRESPARQDGGMGIGLNVVETIMKTHGWRIGVNSVLNEGTEFIITIPKSN